MSCRRASTAGRSSRPALRSVGKDVTNANVFQSQPVARQRSAFSRSGFQEALNVVDRGVGRLADRSPGLDPAVLGLRRGRARREQDEPLGMARDERGDLADVRQERLLLQDEVVGREERQRGAGVPLTNSVSGEEHRGARPAFFRLQEHVRRRSIR